MACAAAFSACCQRYPPLACERRPPGAAERPRAGKTRTRAAPRGAEGRKEGRKEGAGAAPLRGEDGSGRPTRGSGARIGPPAAHTHRLRSRG